jgi:hypothetical protein
MITRSVNKAGSASPVTHLCSRCGPTRRSISSASTQGFWKTTSFGTLAFARRSGSIAQARGK